MYIKRIIQKEIEDRLFKGKVVILYGPRRSGKTTLSKEILAKYPNGKYFLCDNPDVKDALQNKSSIEMKNFIGDTNLVILDEAQNITNVGLSLKILIDTYPDIQIIATGSSSFDLSNKVVEPLTGRKYEFILYPLSFGEIRASKGKLEVERNIEKMMISGLYPDIYLSEDDESIELIEEIKSSYLFKDILAYEEIRNSNALTRLLQLLALQLGNEVSYSELSQKLNIDIKTVQKYVDLLEKIFVIKRLPALSRNARNEVYKSRKIYFYDLGIRNAIIRNFNSLNIRQDVGALWENFCIIEKIKNISNCREYANYYFWRTWEQKEIDFIIEKEGQLNAYEFKYSASKVKDPKEFLNLYPNSTFEVISKKNITDFLG